MSTGELICLIEQADDGEIVDAVSTSFEFGYAKGYRAALSEMKEGGAA